jgi:hypothetical protein
LVTVPPALNRLLSTPVPFIATVLAVMVAGLGLDHFASLGQQYALAVCTWLILLAAMVPLTPLQRSRTMVVVIVATIGEIIASVIWGVYVYRLGNLPMFVPPGHGLVYLTGLRASETAWATRHRRGFVATAVTLMVAWGVLGLSGVLGRHDVAGAVGCATLLLFIWKSRSGATLYCGVFLAVAALEIYGTAIGTWRWAETIPGLGVANGNPPSGAASGYVLFDICALAFGARLLALVRRFRRPIVVPGGPEGEHP